MQRENAEQDVVTSAPPLDFGETWTGDAHEDGQVEVLRRQLAQAHNALENAQHREREERARADAAEREARTHREGHHGALAGLEEARARNAALEAKLAAERERAAACVLRGLDAVHIDDLLAAVERRGLPRPVPAASVLVCRDDAGDHTLKDAAQ